MNSLGSNNYPQPYNGTLPYRDSPKSNGLGYQIIISLVLGLSAFLVFCILRVRYPRIYVANFNHTNQSYVHSYSRRKLPKLPEKSLFGWLPALFSISEEQVLEHAGLDAVVFLGFFKMCIKIIGVCSFFAVTFISPMRYWFTGKVDQDDPDKVLSILKKKHIRKHFFWSYPVFTYVFTIFALYSLFKQTKKIIKMRQEYLGKQNSVTDRTVKISGIPPYLREEEALKRHIESLGMGEVDSVTIVKEWRDIATLMDARDHLRRQAELYWVKYLNALGIININEVLASNVHPNTGDLIRLSSTYQDEEPGSPGDLISVDDANSQHSQRSVIDIIVDRLRNDNQDNVSEMPLLSGTQGRPTIKSGFLGIFGKKIDAINYYTEQLEIIETEIIKARKREYPPSSTAFLTMRTAASAQVLAQAVLDPKINHLISGLAPAPHDIIWENLYLTRNERNMRILIVSVLIGFLSIMLVVPVTYIAKLLNIDIITKAWPKFGAFLKNNRAIEILVTNLLPTYIFTFLNIIMPHIYIWITSKQGYTSHSDEELSSVANNFFYLFVNLFVVFTTAGLASLTDTIQIANQLAYSIIELSHFYVDIIVLQGVGIFCYKLILLGNLLKFSFGSLIWCKTPRDYLDLYRPPIFNFALQLPQPLLIFIITMVYSVVSTKILIAGLIYFTIGFFVFKYQLLYACVHTPHSTGKVWPLVFRRLILGLLIFQFTMVGTLALQKQFYPASFLAPLPLLTLACLWTFQKNYLGLSNFIALKSASLSRVHEDSNDSAENPNLIKTLDELREYKTSYNYPGLTLPFDGALIAFDGVQKLSIKNDGNIVREVITFGHQF